MKQSFIQGTAVALHKGGDKNALTTMKLIQDGVPVVPYSKVVQFLRKQLLGQDVMNAIINGGGYTDTLVVMSDKGRNFGDKISYDIEPLQLDVIITPGYRKEGGLLVSELTSKNSNFIFTDKGQTVTVEMGKEQDSVLLEPVEPGEIGVANKSTLWVPAKKTLDGKPGKKSVFHIMTYEGAAYANLLICQLDNLTGKGHRLPFGFDDLGLERPVLVFDLKELAKNKLFELYLKSTNLLNTCGSVLDSKMRNQIKRLSDSINKMD